MPVYWTEKAPGEVKSYEWLPDIQQGDGVQSYGIVRTAGTAAIDSDALSGGAVIVYLSGGIAGETSIFRLTAVTNFGEELEETAYLPIRATPNAFGYFVSDILNYALRPIVGIRRSPSAAELEDARENLDDMLAELKASGGDIGIKLPTDVNDRLYIADDFISALKNGLRVRIAEVYGQPLSPVTVAAAQRGLQRIKSSLLPDERKAVYF